VESKIRLATPKRRRAPVRNVPRSACLLRRIEPKDRACDVLDGGPGRLGLVTLVTLVGHDVVD
jgi:hypothetical protein